MGPLSPHIAGGVLVVECHQGIGIDLVQTLGAEIVGQHLDDGFAAELFDRRSDTFVGLGQIANIHAQGHRTGEIVEFVLDDLAQFRTFVVFVHVVDERVVKIARGKGAVPQGEKRLVGIFDIAAFPFSPQEAHVGEGLDHGFVLQGIDAQGVVLQFVLSVGSAGGGESVAGEGLLVQEIFPGFVIVVAHFAYYLDDLPAVRKGEDAGRLSRFEGKDHIFDLGQQFPDAVKAKVAPVGLGGGIFGVIERYIGKTVAFFQPVVSTSDVGQGLGVERVGTFAHHQDVRQFDHSPCRTAFDRVDDVVAEFGAHRSREFAHRGLVSGGLEGVRQLECRYEAQITGAPAGIDLHGQRVERSAGLERPVDRVDPGAGIQRVFFKPIPRDRHQDVRYPYVFFRSVGRLTREVFERFRIDVVGCDGQVGVVGYRPAQGSQGVDALGASLVVQYDVVDEGVEVFFRGKSRFVLRLEVGFEIGVEKILRIVHLAVYRNERLFGLFCFDGEATGSHREEYENISCNSHHLTDRFFR